MFRSTSRWALVVLGMGFIAGSAHSAEPPKLPAFVSGVEFRKTWGSEVNARLDGVSLRTVLEKLCTERRIAWVIDRRLDPDQRVVGTPLAAPLSEFLPQLLEPLDADAVVVGSTVIVGPKESTQWLRTLAELQRGELQKSGLAAARKQALGRMTELRWEDLSEPARVVRSFAAESKIELSGGDLIPYDLWGSGHLVGVTPGEALTVLGWQYDLQWKWEASGNGTLIPLKLPISVSRAMAISEARRKDAQTQFPGVKIEAAGKSMQVIGRIEEIEALDLWLKGGAKPRPRLKKPDTDWRNRTFDLTIKNTPLRDVLRGLTERGIPIQWDEQALLAAGVDLTVKINFELKDAKTSELLSALCDPAKLKFELTSEGATILPP